MKQLFLLICLSVINYAYAEVNIYTEHKLIIPIEGNIDSSVYNYDSSFNPYIADIGISYSSGNSIYYGGYEYKQNYDLKNGNAYNFSGVFLRYKYTYCISKCK